MPALPWCCRWAATGLTHPGYNCPNHARLIQAFVIANADAMLDKCAARL
jgi:hypothetical protein